MMIRMMATLETTLMIFFVVENSDDNGHILVLGRRASVVANVSKSEAAD